LQARFERIKPEYRSLVGRYYDPGTGQFLTVDPDISETGQAYAYTGDDPVNGVDPLGLCWPSWACGAEHKIGGAATDVGRAVGGAATDVGSFVANHAGEIALAASLAALAIPGVDVIDLGVVAGLSVNGTLAATASTLSIVAGGVASGEDYSNGDYLSGTLDLIGSFGSLGALHLAGISNLERFAASISSRSSYLQSWLLQDSADLAKIAKFISAGAFGFGLPSAWSLLFGTSAGASVSCG
jgi:hypothetical protein